MERFLSIFITIWVWMFILVFITLGSIENFIPDFWDRDGRLQVYLNIFFAGMPISAIIYSLPAIYAMHYRDKMQTARWDAEAKAAREKQSDIDK